MSVNDILQRLLDHKKEILIDDERDEPQVIEKLRKINDVMKELDRAKGEAKNLLHDLNNYKMKRDMKKGLK